MTKLSELMGGFPQLRSPGRTKKSGTDKFPIFRKKQYSQRESIYQLCNVKSTKSPAKSPGYKLGTLVLIYHIYLKWGMSREIINFSPPSFLNICHGPTCKFSISSISNNSLTASGNHLRAGSCGRVTLMNPCKRTYQPDISHSSRLET
jgi:hypothetical protein